MDSDFLAFLTIAFLALLVFCLMLLVFLGGLFWVQRPDSISRYGNVSVTPHEFNMIQFPLAKLLDNLKKIASNDHTNVPNQPFCNPDNLHIAQKEAASPNQQKDKLIDNSTDPRFSDSSKPHQVEGIPVNKLLSGDDHIGNCNHDKEPCWNQEVEQVEEYCDNCGQNLYDDFSYDCYCGKCDSYERQGLDWNEEVEQVEEYCDNCGQNLYDDFSYDCYCGKCDSYERQGLDWNEEVQQDEGEDEFDNY